MLDLRTFLQENDDQVIHLRQPLSVRYEITALQYHLWHKHRHPILLIEQPRLADGSISRHQAVANLTASREVTARALRLSSHRAAAYEVSEKLSQPVEPITVNGREAPVKEVVLRGNEATVAHLPIFTQHEQDAGPYLTAAHATTYDPETGIDNTAIQRVWVRQQQELGYFPYPASHNRQNVLKFWERGEAAPIAFWIGHHPAVSIGAQAKLDYPESHWGRAGAMAGEPVRLVATELFGEKIKVPAEAEIVLEGFVPPHRLEPEGPFGEYTSYMGEATASPVFELRCVTQRRDAIYHDYASGLPDSLVPDNAVIEAKLYQLARQVSPAVRNVYVPVSGRRFHAYIQTRDVSAETAREILRAALAFRRVKLVVLVGEDIDLFDEEQVLWAIATRTQMDRDALILSNLPGSMLDPSLPPGQANTAKLGINATWTLGPGQAKPQVSRIPTHVWEAMDWAAILEAKDL